PANGGSHQPRIRLSRDGRCQRPEVVAGPSGSWHGGGRCPQRAPADDRGDRGIGGGGGGNCWAGTDCPQSRLRLRAGRGGAGDPRRSLRETGPARRRGEAIAATKLSSLIHSFPLPPCSPCPPW